MKYILIMILGYSCMLPKRNQKEIQPNELIGMWDLTTNQVDYAGLRFQKDSIAILYSLGDTVYWFKYYMKKKNLFLMNQDGLFKNKILKLTKDSLVFENLVEFKTKQVYSRVKKE